MPASMIMAPVGSSFIVSGSSIAIVAGGPSPGSTPITVPSTTPITHIMRFCAVSATWNPCSRPPRISTLEEHAARKRKVQRQLEERVEARGSDDGHDERGAKAFAAHHPHDERGQQRECDGESHDGHDRHAHDEGRPRAHGPRNVPPPD